MLTFGKVQSLVPNAIFRSLFENRVGALTPGFTGSFSCSQMVVATIIYSCVCM